MKYAILLVLAAILAAAALSSPAPKPLPELEPAPKPLPELEPAPKPPIAAASDPYAAVPESELTYGDAEAYSR